MGRWAYFSTDYEYKFWFAIQSSEDILDFGGWDSNKYDMPTHKWLAAEDLEYIKAKLLACARENGLTLPDFEKFEKSIDGTNALAMSIENTKFKDEKVTAWFYLGCIIYQQLLWNSELTARYEL